MRRRCRPTARTGNRSVVRVGPRPYSAPLSIRPCERSAQTHATPGAKEPVSSAEVRQAALLCRRQLLKSPQDPPPATEQCSIGFETPITDSAMPTPSSPFIVDACGESKAESLTAATNADVCRHQATPQSDGTPAFSSPAPSDRTTSKAYAHYVPLQHAWAVQHAQVVQCHCARSIS